jgi:hypothetical protein
VRNTLPLVAPDNSIVLSQLPEAKVSPFGENAMELTVLVWPASVRGGGISTGLGAGGGAAGIAAGDAIGVGGGDVDLTVGSVFAETSGI